MRDYRDAKAMAASLRQALKAKAVTLTHSESLELIAKAFALDNWNILAAKIEAAAGPLPASAAPDGKTRFCSFCGKPQQEVEFLIAGPESLICNECVQLCDDIIDDQSIAKLEREAKARNPDADPTAIVRAHLAAMSREQLLASKQRTERWLHHIHWSLNEIDGSPNKVDAAGSRLPRERPGALRDPLAGLTPDQVAAKRAELEALRAQVVVRLSVAEQVLEERPA